MKNDFLIKMYAPKKQPGNNIDKEAQTPINVKSEVLSGGARMIQGVKLKLK